MSTPKIPIPVPDEDTPRSLDAYDAPEHPTVKRKNPIAPERAPLQERTTMKMKKAEIEALVNSEKDASGTRPAVSDDDIAKFEREREAEARKTNV